ncbi:MAG: hypothetical protein ACREIY_05235, partial [Candidatus Rokuibacteriota bacterium]
VWLVACLVVAPGCAPTRIASDVPLLDRPVQPPGPEIPSELAAFSGRWVGTWTDGRDYRKNMALIIERFILPDRAVGFYGCGHPYPTGAPVCPGSLSVVGRLEEGTLKIDYPLIRAQGRYRISGRFLEGELVSWDSGRVLIRVTAARLP